MKNFLSGILFCVLALSGYAQDNYVDSLKKELASLHDTTSLKIYYDLFVYYSDYDNNIAEQYADTLLFVSQKYESEHWEAIAYWSKGLVKYLYGDYGAAANFYDKAEVIAKKNSNALMLYKVYNNFGMIYYELRDFKAAHKYYNMAIDNAIIIGDDDSYALTLVNIANLYYETKDYNRIFTLYDSAFNMADNIDIRISILNNLAYLQYNIGDIESSKNTFNNLLSLLDKGTDIHIYTSALNSIASIYIREGEYDKAIDNLRIVDSICTANSFEELRLKLYQNYYEYYCKIGDYEHTKYYIDSYNWLNDSIYSAELSEELKELENKNLREKNELEMKRRDEKILHQRSLNIMLFVVVALILAFAVFIAFMLVKKSRLNRTLNKLNADLKQRDEEISSNLDYAREIQLGCMSNNLMDSNLQMFVLDRPKVVVGGDFYISQTKSDATYVVVGDCTGHGISGGFLSVLGIKSVYAAIEKYDTLPEMASFINNEFCEIVSSAENLKGESLCLSMVRICGNELRFLGSKQKMWIVSGDKGDCSSVSPLACKPEVCEYKSSNAIMGSAVNEEFAEEIINVKSGDVVFLSSDGYPDQFGAEGKLKYSRFRNLLLECSQMKPDKAKEFLSAKLDLWRGDLEQTDDVMVVGMYF